MSSATKFATYLKGGWHKFWSGEYSTTLPVLADGERAIAQVDSGGRLLVGGKLHRQVTVAQVTSAAAYGAGDGIGGKITVANAVRLPALSGLLKSIQANFKSDNITATVKVAIFKADPAASTFADNEAPSLHANDLMKLIGEYTLGAQMTDLGANSIFLVDNINKPFQLAGTSLYAVAWFATGTPTLGTTSDCEITFGIEQD